jgi:hypothetical protein
MNWKALIEQRKFEVKASDRALKGLKKALKKGKLSRSEFEARKKQLNPTSSRQVSGGLPSLGKHR